MTNNRNNKYQYVYDKESKSWKRIRFTDTDEGDAFDNFVVTPQKNPDVIGRRKRKAEQAESEQETRERRIAANNKYNQQRDDYIKSKVGELDVSPNPYSDDALNPTYVTKGLYAALYALKNMFGTTAEKMDEGDMQSTGSDISRTRQNIGAAEAHKSVLNLQRQRQQLLDSGEDVSDQIAEIDNQLKSLEELDNLYKKTYIGENPIGIWNRTKEFFKDDLWEGIQDAMTYDFAKGYTKRRRQEEVNKEYDRQLKEKGVLTGDNRQYSTPTGVVEHSDYTRELEDANQFISQNNAALKELGDEYKQKLRKLEDTKARWNVASGYKDLIEAYQNGRLFDPMYAFSEYAQMLGSSMSSTEQLIASGVRAATTAAAFGAAATGQAWAAPVILNASELALTPLDYAGAIQENDIERNEKFISNVEAILKSEAFGGKATYDRIIGDLREQIKESYKEAGLTDEQIEDRLSGSQANKNILEAAAAGLAKNEDPLFKQALLYANRGLAAQQDANNMRTVSDLILQKAIVWMPGKKWLGGKVWTSVDNAAERAVASGLRTEVGETAKKTLHTRLASAEGSNFTRNEILDRYQRIYGTKYKNATLSGAIKHGYEAGVETGAVLGQGLVGQHVFGAAAATANAAVYMARRNLSPKAQALLAQVEKFGAKKYQAVYDKLLGNSDFAKLAVQYGLKQAKVNTISAFSEGAEEAAQYIHEKNDEFAKKYGWDGMSLGDMIINDVSVGGEIMNAYLAMLGIGDSPWANDAEFWSNWKGGAMLGFTNQSSLVNAVVRGVETAKQYKVDKVLTDAAIVNRELDDRDRASYVDVARQVMSNNTQYVLNYLDRMEAEENRRGERRVTTQEDIDATRKAVLDIAGLANSNTVRTELEESGTEYGTEDYAIAIADKYALRKQSVDIANQRKSGVGQLSQVYTSKEFNQEVDEQVQIVNAQNAAFKADKSKHQNQAGDIAVNKAIAVRETAKQKQQAIDSENVDAEYSEYVNLSEQEREYLNMSNEEFNKKLGEIRANAENVVDSSSDALLREQLVNRAKAINRLTALLNLKAKFNTIDGFFNFIHENLKLSPMRPDAKTIMENLDLQIKNAKDQLKATDYSYEERSEKMSDKELLDYLQNGGIIGVNAHKEVAQEIEQENAVLTAWAQVVGDHMTQTGEKYKRRIEAIKKAREDNQKLNWMLSEIDSGDAVTRLDKKFKKEAEAAAKRAQREANKQQKSQVPEFEAPSQREDGQKSNLKVNKEEFERRRQAAKQRKINFRKKYRRRDRLMVQLPFQNVLLDIATELMYAAEVGAYKFAEFFADLKEVAENNGINIDDYVNDIKQFYIRFRAKASNNIKQNLEQAPDVIKFFSAQLPPVKPADRNEDLSLQQKINNQQQNIVHDISSHFDVVYDDGTERKIYVNKEAVKFSGYEDSTVMKDIVAKLKAANKTDESFEQQLNDLYGQVPNFPIQTFVRYRNVEGIEEAIVRHTLGEAKTGVRVGKLVRTAVQSILHGIDADEVVQFFGDSYQGLKEQVTKIKEELDGELTLLSTPDFILYEDAAGKNCAALADVVFSDQSGQLYIIDVRSTIYPSIRTHYDYINKKGFSIHEQVLETLKDADEALYKLHGRRAKGLYMLPVVVKMNSKGTFDAEQGRVEYDENGKALLLVKDRNNPEISDDLNVLKTNAQKIVDNLNDKIDEYNDLIQQAGSYNTTHNRIENKELTEQQSAALYDEYISALSEELEDVNEQISKLKGEIASNMQTLKLDIKPNIPLDSNNQFVETPEAVQNLTECAKELDAAYEQFKKAGLLVLIAKTYDERAIMDKFISALIDAQVALDIALSNEDASRYDFTPETTLIASALQTIAKSPNNYGEAGISVRNWWINNFSFGIKNNTTKNISSISEREAAYLNTLNNWINTLMYEDEDDRWVFKPELVKVLDDPKNVNVRRWYSSIMFTGLDNLIKNFKEAIAENPNYDKSYDSRISFAEWMLQQFNLAWGTETDPTITNNPTDYLERLGNLSVKWKDLYNESDSHSPAYASNPNDARSMATNQSYQALSKTAGFPNNCKFDLDIKNGEVRLWVIGNDVNGKQQVAILPFFCTPYPGISDKDARYMQIFNRGNLKFVDKVKSLIEYTKKHPEYELRFDVTANRGSINYDYVGNTHNVQEWLMPEKDLYNIKLSKDDGIGILRVTDNGQNGLIYYVYGGNELRQVVGKFDDKFRKQKINSNSGSIIYFKKSGTEEIGVTIEPVQIGQQRATTIVDLIAKKASGVKQENGFSIDDLLYLMLYTKDPEGRVSKYNNIRSLVQIDGPMVKIGENNPLNVFTERQSIIDQIAALNIVTDAETLNTPLQTSSLQCFQMAKQLIARGAKYVDLPIGIRITAEDIIHQNQNGANGTTWLGFMLRNGLLQTRAVGESYKQINISNVRLENKDNIKPGDQSTGQQQQSSKKQTYEYDDIDALFTGLTMKVPEERLIQRESDESISSFQTNVEEYFRQVFGDDAQSFWKFLEDGIISKLPTGYVVGLCTSDFMALSRYAPEEAGWHEAFHRILELLCTESQRNVFYSAYSEKFGTTDQREIAEGLADMYVDFMNKLGMPKGGVFNKIKRFFKVICAGTVVARKFGIGNTRRLFAFFNDINGGKYRARTVSEENRKRMETLFGGSLAYTVKNPQTGQYFNAEHIADSGELNNVVKSVGYYIIKSLGYDATVPQMINYDDWQYLESSIISGNFGGKFKSKSKASDSVTIDESLLDLIPSDTLSNLRGDGIAEDKLTSSQRVFREILTRENIGSISGHIAQYIESVLSVQSRGNIEKAEDEQDLEGEDFGENMDPQNLNIDRFDKASYEFSKLASVSNQVKLFLATIPYMTFNEQGKLVEDTSINPLGTPQFMPLEEVYNVLENDLSDVKSIDDLYNKLKKLAINSPMHRAVFAKFHRLVYGDSKTPGIYGSDQFGNLVCTDYDREQLAIQITSALSSQKIDFIVALSETLKDDGGKDVRISSSSLERDARSLPKQWGQILTSGQSQTFAQSKNRDGQLQFRDRTKHNKNDNPIAEIVRFFQNVRSALSTDNGTVNIGGKEYNKDSVDGIQVIKQEFVKNLHKLGIMISEKAFDYMLLNGFGNQGAQGFEDCLNGIGNADKFKPQNIDSFINLLNSIVDNQGDISEETITKGYPDNGFIKQLATWQGIYNRVTVQNMALGLNGKQLFSISQNSAISHVIEALNSGDLNNEVISTLMKFNYNISGGNIPIGSIILKAIRNRDGFGKISAHTYIGLKTDNFGDNGSEYTEAAEIDDYIAKLTMLQEGYLLFPTLADKGTWVVLKGVNIPGMRLITSRKGKNKSVTCENPVQVTFVGGKPYIMPSDDVIDQMIEYAQTERQAIVRCMQEIDSIPDEAKVSNYHTVNKNTPKDKNGKPKFLVEPNGTRFLQLTKVYVEENGKLVGKNLNDPKKSSKDMLAEADKYFFNLDINKQRRIMGLTLAVQAENEIKKAVDLGLVEHYDLNKSWKTSSGEEVNVKFSASENTLWNLRSSHLNRLQINAVSSELLKQIPHKQFKTWAQIPNDALNTSEKFAKIEMVNGLAVAAILADATFRHIISSQEILRCFAGHPGMFKVEYGENEIKNSTADIQKRLGGLVSTGEDNIKIPGLPETYTCAELNDYKVASKSAVADQLADMFSTAQVRNVYGILTNDWEKAYSSTKEELFAEVDQNDKLKLEKADEDGKNFASMFSGGINVADGAAYITDEMCENLLRMRGAYNNKVKAAFDLLRSDQAISWKKSKEAYQTIYDAVNLVTTKYTAYGFRPHVVNGIEHSNISVPYYNKYALFPLFKCIASGKMEKIYEKMIDEGVDMLMMTSAVKVGSCGAVKFNGEEIDAPFNTYEQSFGYLRRQLNTDPEEGREMTMGTQMIKICLQNLIGGRSYKDQRTGRTVSGDEILEDMMGAINNLSSIGESEIVEMFSSDKGRTIDPQKLATYLQDQLTSRNANKVLLDIIRPYTKNGKVNLHALSATSDASWIESIIISTVNKRVIDITTPGASYVQRSVFAMDAKEGEGSIQGDAEMSADINGGKRLEMFNPDGSMDCVISINFFDDLFKGKNMSFDEKRQFLIDNGIIGNGAKANIVAYRIPTQAQSSIHALHVADVIPAVKDTIILPEEFTTITGSDFDIDHLYLARYNYQYDKNTKKLTSWMKKGSKEYYQNKLLGNMLTLLTDKDSINTTYKSIDSDVQLPKGCSEQIHTQESFESEPYNFGTLRAQVSVKNDFTSGKVSIGPFALNSTNHMLTSHFDVRFRPTIVTENTKIKGFSQMLDDDGNFISAWLSGYISGAVDNAKDPFLAKLNTNQFTYNMLNLLLRSGFGETAVWFCAQPIIRDMSAANERSKSQYAKDQSHKNSGLSRKEYAIMQAIKNYVPESSLTASALKKWTTSTQKQDLWDRVRAINWLEQNTDVLKEFATNQSLQRVTVNGVDYNREYVQQKVFFAWKSLEKYAVALGGLVQHTKIDTRKHGKSIIEINRYLDDYNKIFHPAAPEKSIWDVKSLQDFANRTWIEQKTRSAISLPSFVLQHYVFSANPSFIRAVLEFGRLITEPGEQLSSTVATKISRHLQTAVKSQYFVNYVAENLVKRDKDGVAIETADQHIRNLFVGPKSMSKRLTGLKLAIELNPAYKRLANNGLIKQMYSMPEDEPQVLNGELTEKPAFITVLDNVDSSRLNSDLLIDGWEDLLTDPDEHVRAFAQDLIVYAFMSSGEFKGWSKLFKYVPASWITGELIGEQESYSDYIERVLSGSYDYTQHFDDIAANCFSDRSIVDLIPQKNHDGTENFVDVNTIVKIGRGVDVTEIDAVKQYILVKNDQKSRNVDSFNLYKLVGFKHNLVEESVNPVYIRIKKRGYSNKSLNVYEYGWEFEWGGNEKRVMNEKYNISAAVKAMSDGNYITSGSTAESVRAKYLQLATPHVEEAPVEHSELNDTYDYSDWKYLEDSGYSGALEELNIPEKVRMNGEMTYRPRYNFGRIYLTENEKRFIEERISIVDENGDTLNINANRLNSLIESLSKLYDKLVDTGDRNVVVKYRDWKQMLQSDDNFEYFIENAVVGDLKDWSGFGYDSLIGKYDKSSKTIQIQQDFYDMVKVLKDNFDIVKSISQALNDSNYYSVAHLLLNFENIYDAVQALNTDAENFFYSNSYSGGFQLKYSYKDSRQLDLFENNPMLKESERQNNISPSNLGTKDNPIQIYSDGSDIKGTGNIGFGAVFEYDGKQYGLSGTEESQEVKKLAELFPNAKFSNPTMEMLALTTVLESIAKAGIGEHIQINQDYKGAVNYGALWNYSEGSNQRASKPWNAKEPYIKHLVERSEKAIEQILQNGGSVKINWVKGHQTSGTEQARMNDAADRYAKDRTNFNNILDAYNKPSDESQAMHKQC